MIALLALVAFLGSPPGSNGLATVPGAVDPSMTASILCDPAWRSSSVRPPTSVTNKLKFELMAEAGIPRSDARLYELDHDISLEIGGAPDDPNNLWLEPYAGPLNARVKDRLENKLHSLVCSGQLSLSDAQRAIGTDWVAAYRKFVGPLP